MNLDEIKEIIELMREHELAEFELERDGLKIRLRKEVARPAPVPASAPADLTSGVTGSATPETIPAKAGSPADGLGAPDLVEGQEALELAVVKSPIVGTFYRAPDPNAPPFVEIGNSVKKGQVLCIIEAMKLMNEIDSEYDGEVMKIYVENGQPVQYGERLFAIKTRA